MLSQHNYDICNYDITHAHTLSGHVYPPIINAYIEYRFHYTHTTTYVIYVYLTRSKITWTPIFSCITDTTPLTNCVHRFTPTDSISLTIVKSIFDINTFTFSKSIFAKKTQHYHRPPCTPTINTCVKKNCFVFSMDKELCWQQYLPGDRWMRICDHCICTS